MNVLLIIYTYASILLGYLCYQFFDIPVAGFFYSRLYDDLWVLFDYITEAGEGGYWIYSAGIMYLAYRYLPISKMPFGEKLMEYRQADMRTSGFVLLTAIVSGIAVNLLKIVFARYRPELYFKQGDYGFSWFDQTHLLASFPSGHSATAMAVATALTLLFPRYGWFFIITGVVIIFSRVVLAEHYISDVIAGGYLGVITSVYLFNRYFKQKSY